MHHRAKDLTGQQFNFLTALSFAGSDGKKSLWNVRCICGVEKIISASELGKLKIKSCGCKRNELTGSHQITHGMSKHPTYGVWRSMVDRCKLPTHQAWKNYGGRGIKVCERWVEKFENFWADMGQDYESGLTLDRKDVNSGYSKENCRWITMKMQARNKQVNTFIETPWGLITVAEAAERSGIGQTTLHYRLKHNWPNNLLFTKPDLSKTFSKRLS